MDPRKATASQHAAAVLCVIVLSFVLHALLTLGGWGQTGAQASMATDPALAQSIDSVLYLKPGLR